MRCPACRLGDQVRAVNAVLLDGHATSQSVTQYRRAVTDTARLLALPPMPPPRTAWYGWIAVLAGYCLCWALVGVASWRSRPPPSETSVSPLMDIIAPTFFAAPGLVALPLVIWGLVRLKRKDRLRRDVAPWVAAIHQRAWYCARCAGAFFLAGTVPEAVVTEALIPVGAFRDSVWLLGYHHWRARQQSSATSSSSSAQ
jgi:hypothetical protein